MFFYYYLTSVFVNDSSKKAYFGFLIIYCILTYAPVFFGLLCSTISDDRNKNGCKQFTMALLSLLHLQFLVVSLGPSFDIKYSYKTTLKITGTIRAVAQILLQVTLITIQSINQVDTFVKALTIGFSGFQILFNVFFSVTININ
jgi:hypothetical protein